MREVGERDDARVAHAHGLLQHGFGVAQVLEGVDLQHHVEAVVGKDRQAAIQVHLQHVDAAFGAGQQFSVFGIAWALQSLYDGNAHAGGQVRIFSVGFLAPAPAGIAENVDVGRPDREAQKAAVFFPASNGIRNPPDSDPVRINPRTSKIFRCISRIK